jgi:hypothetical protein
MEPAPQARRNVARSGSPRNHAPAQRSRVTNGKSPFVIRELRGPWARRFRDVLGEIISDLSGPEGLSEGQRQLARRAATISILCEQMECQAAAGNEVDADQYGSLSDRLGRCFGRLGIDSGRVAKNVTPSLDQYLASHSPRPASEAAE